MATADGAEARKSIIRTAWILTGLTAFEFLIAFTKQYYAEWFGLSEAAADMIVLVTFVVLTLFKAFYIVAEFMHLKHEVKRLAFTIVVPFLFVIWLIIGLIVEGSTWDTKSGETAMSEQSWTTESWKEA